MIIIITGKPGKGKTLTQTAMVKKFYKKDNNLIQKIIYYSKYKTKMPIVNKCFSNYPILLDKKNNIKTKKVSLKHMVIKNKFPKGSHIVIDEAQIMYDSMDFERFPVSIGHFWQTHRHLFIHDIITNSQSLARIIKKMRDLAEYYYDIMSFRDSLLWGLIPLPFVFVKIRITYDTLSADQPKQKSNYLYDSKLFVFNKRSLYNCYNDKYLSELQRDSIPFDSPEWESLVMSKEDIFKYFFISADEKDKLSRLEY